MHSACRLYVAEPLNLRQEVRLEDKKAHYLSHVLRVKSGQHIKLFNAKDGEWLAEITNITKHAVTAQPTQQTRPQTHVPHMVVCIAPIKSSRMEGMIEKATELGARAIQPVITSRTIVRKINEARIRLIAIEAAEQSERLDVPEILPAVELRHLLANWPEERLLVFGDESGDSPIISLNRFRTNATQHGWGILVGPEGGFTAEEFSRLRAMPFACGTSLGPRILRAETACTCLCTITMQQLGDWHERPAFTY